MRITKTLKLDEPKVGNFLFFEATLPIPNLRTFMSITLTLPDSIYIYSNIFRSISY